MPRLLSFGLVLATLLGSGPGQAAEDPLPDGLYAEFRTPRGSFVCALFPERTPLTVANFVALAEGTHPHGGGRHYANLRWYRVVPGFVLQSGDPRGPAGGEAGYAFPDELVPGLRHDAPGVLSMANAGPDTNADEFFVTLASTSVFVLTLGVTNWPIVASLAAGGLVAAPVGAKLAGVIPRRPLMILVGAVVVVLSLRVLYLSLR